MTLSNIQQVSWHSTVVSYVSASLTSRYWQVLMHWWSWCIYMGYGCQAPTHWCSCPPYWYPTVQFPLLDPQVENWYPSLLMVFDARLFMQVSAASSLELDKTVICSTHQECNELNDLALSDLTISWVPAVDTDDHNSKPLRKADHEHIQCYREQLPNALVLKDGTRVILKQNMDIEGGWVNHTLQV